MKNRKNVLKGIFCLLRTSWAADKKLTVVLFINNILRSLVIPLKALTVKGILDLVNTAVREGYSDLFRKQFIILGILFLLIFLINRIWWPINSYAQNMALAKISNYVKRKIMETALEYRLEFFDYKENYDALKLAKEQVNGRRAIVIINNVISFVSQTITFIVAAIPMISYSIVLLLLLIIASIPRLFLQGKLNNKVFEFRKATTTAVRQKDYVFSLFSNKQALKEIKFLNAADSFKNKYTYLYNDFLRKNNRLELRRFLADFPFWFIQQLVIIIAYYFFIRDASNLHITIGEAGYFISIAGSLTNSFFLIGTSFNSAIESGLYGSNLLTIYNNPLVERETLITDLDFNIGEIVFDDVSFAYPDGTLALSNINLKIELKNIYAIVGLNGSGKSTLIKLLLKLYQPTSGTIYFNGIDINEINIKTWWEVFSVSFQDYANYNFSFAESIAMNDTIDYKKLDMCINRFDLKEVVERLPDGYDTPLAKDYQSGGTELSIGQQNKVSLARALYKNGDIIILDEPTASLDAFAEASLFKKMNEIIQGKTGIFISHRLSTTKYANKVFVLKDGQLIEAGSHLDLYNNQGYYYDLFSLQAQKYQVNQNEEK